MDEKKVEAEVTQPTVECKTTLGQKVKGFYTKHKVKIWTAVGVIVSGGTVAAISETVHKNDVKNAIEVWEAEKEAEAEFDRQLASAVEDRLALAASREPETGNLEVTNAMEDISPAVVE